MDIHCVPGGQSRPGLPVWARGKRVGQSRLAGDVTLDLLEGLNN